MGNQFVQLILSLIAVVGAIIAFAFVMKRFGIANFKTNAKLTVLATVPVSNKEKLLLVQVGQEQLLLGATQHSINMLHKLDHPIDLQTASDNPLDTVQEAT